MLVLTIILAPTINLKADTYVAKDNVVVGSNIHDFYNNYFSDKESYQYFPYDCGDRTCYFGINNSKEYVRLYYSGNYNNNLQIQTGIDENFIVTGVNVFKHDVSFTYQLLIAFSFVSLIILFLKMIGGVIRVK